MNVDGSKPVFIQLYGGQVGQFVTTCNPAGTSRPLTPDDDNIDDVKRRFDIRRYQISGDVNQTGIVQALATTHQIHKKLLVRFQAHIAQTQMSLSYATLIAMQGETFSYLDTTTFSMYGNGITPTGTLSAAALAAATTVTSAIASEFMIGQSIIIGYGLGSQEDNVITNIVGPTITLQDPLDFAHAAGEQIQLYEINLLITEFTPSVEREYNHPSGTGPVVRKVWEATIENRIQRAARSIS
jgi:hypothetical protein